MECKRDLSITNVLEMKYLHFVRDAVYAYAHALNNMHRDLCPNSTEVCSQMHEHMRNRLTDYIANVTFDGQFNFLSFK
jgi:Receptor family ligand binding region